MPWLFIWLKSNSNILSHFPFIPWETFWCFQPKLVLFETKAYLFGRKKFHNETVFFETTLYVSLFCALPRLSPNQTPSKSSVQTDSGNSTVSTTVLNITVAATVVAVAIAALTSPLFLLTGRNRPGKHLVLGEAWHVSIWFYRRWRLRVLKWEGHSLGQSLILAKSLRLQAWRRAADWWRVTSRQDPSTPHGAGIGGSNGVSWRWWRHEGGYSWLIWILTRLKAINGGCGSHWGGGGRTTSGLYPTVVVDFETVFEAESETASVTCDLHKLFRLASFFVTSIVINLAASIWPTIPVQMLTNTDVWHLTTLERHRLVAQRADWHLKVFAMCFWTTMNVVWKMVLAESLGTAVTFHREEVELFAGRVITMLAKVGELHCALHFYLQGTVAIKSRE